MIVTICMLYSLTENNPNVLSGKAKTDTIYTFYKIYSENTIKEITEEYKEQSKYFVVTNLGGEKTVNVKAFTMERVGE